MFKIVERWKEENDNNDGSLWSCCRWCDQQYVFLYYCWISDASLAAQKSVCAYWLGSGRTLWQFSVQWLHSQVSRLPGNLSSGGIHKEVVRSGDRQYVFLYYCWISDASQAAQKSGKRGQNSTKFFKFRVDE